MKVLSCAGPGMRKSKISIAPGLCANLGARTSEALKGNHGFLLIDSKVATKQPHLNLPDLPGLSLVGGESSKSLQVAARVLSAMAQAGLDRDSMLVVVGGGSLGDLGGLVASLYLRGINLIQVPTSLLAMVDSSVGGKTAINLPEGKNLAGSFWPAKEVWIDTDLLTSLPEAEFRSGMGEVLKIAIGLSPELFALLSNRAMDVQDASNLSEIIALALQAKIRVVEEDPLEQDARRLLNLGHSLGHALECASEFTTPHGEAVVQGIFFVLNLSKHLGQISHEDAAACRDLLQTHGYVEQTLPDRDQLLRYLRHDKKMRSGNLGAVLPTGCGHSIVRAMKAEAFIDPAGA